MGNEKFYLDEVGLQALITYIQESLEQKLNKDQLPDDIVKEEDLLSLATKEDLEKVKIKAESAFHVKGSVDDLNALLQIENPREGDVYNLLDSGINAVWTGEEWDELGVVIDIDGFLEEQQVYPISQNRLTTLLYDGKSAVVSNLNDLSVLLNNNEPEVEILLVQNLTETIVIPENKSVKLDLGGNTIPKVQVSGGQLSLSNGLVKNTNCNNALEVKDGGSLTLDNTTVVGMNNNGIVVQGNDASLTMNSGTVIAQEAGILAGGQANITINGGTISCVDNGAIMTNGTAGRGGNTIIMNGGRLEGHITSPGYLACAVYLPNDDIFIMRNGEIVSDGAGIVMRGGQVKLDNGTIRTTGTSGVSGRVGDSRVPVGSYAIVYDTQSNYPAKDSLKLIIGENVQLSGADGDIGIIGEEKPNIYDNR